MKALAISTVVCVACTLTCNAVISALSFGLFVVTAAVYSWEQSKQENK